MLTSIRGFLAASSLAGVALAATPAFAQDETDPPGDITISGYAQVVSDYRFRGISQSEGKPAVQGSITVTHSSGFYVGTWASSLHDTPVLGKAEVDLYAGWTGDVASGITADAGLLYYVYPDGKVGDANRWEPYASLTAALGPATAKIGVNYAWEQDALNGGDNLYVYGEVGTAIPDLPLPVSIIGHLGYSDGARSPRILTGSGQQGGFDWSLGATANLTRNISIGASYVGVQGASIDDLSTDTVVGTLKFAF